MEWVGRSGIHYSTGWMSSKEANRASENERKSAERKPDGEAKDRQLRRADDYAGLAEQLAASEKEAERVKKEQRLSRAAATRRSHDSFIAQYGAGDERKRARKRLGWSD